VSSPRTWGWTAGGCAEGSAGPVVPTHVGVDRVPRTKVKFEFGRPHARGGGPSLAENSVR